MYSDDDEEPEFKGRRFKGKKVDVRGLMKRPITSARAPSIPRKASQDHTHDEHDHDHSRQVRNYTLVDGIMLGLNRKLNIGRYVRTPGSTSEPITMK